MASKKFFFLGSVVFSNPLKGIKFDVGFTTVSISVVLKGICGIDRPAYIVLQTSAYI